ncbi:MAG TPA: aldo/keto reductase [Gemmatimonadaceae bacterium]|jgi:pyridoxine 4-dehydrogenase|nr:aldo/keto reductase [Gemmatimonadaceae bacterium]
MAQSQAVTGETQTVSAGAAGTITIGGDMPVARLGFGSMRLTGTGIWGPPANHTESIAVLKRAVELGVTFIDTADSYGPEVAENLIAEALYPYPKGLVIATKGGYRRTGPNQWTPQGDPQHLRAACNGSLKRLKLDRIDLYQFHVPDPAVPYEDSIGALVDLQREGKIRHIGVSNVKVDHIKQARALVKVVSVQNRYSPADRSSDAVIDYCEKEKMPFIPWGPVGSGKGLRNAGIETAARAHHASEAQIALAWLLARSPVVLPIPGTSSVAHLDQNIAAAGIKLTADEFKTIAKG